MYPILILLFLTLAVAVFCICFAKPFSYSRRYIKLELRRSYNESERRYWKREMKKLYVSYIPIIGKRLVKFIRK